MKYYDIDVLDESCTVLIEHVAVVSKGMYSMFHTFN